MQALGKPIAKQSVGDKAEGDLLPHSPILIKCTFLVVAKFAPPYHNITRKNMLMEIEDSYYI